MASYQQLSSSSELRSYGLRRFIVQTNRSCNCLLALFAFVFVASTYTSTAQEVRFIDLTLPVEQRDVRRPPATADQSRAHGGTEEMHSGCAPKSQTVGALETTLLSIDRTKYQVGEIPIFEVQIKNVGDGLLELPVATNLVDVQPDDPSQKFAYYVLQLEFWIGGRKWSSNTGGAVAFYGNKEHTGTTLPLHPGEWLRIRAKGKIELPSEVDTLTNSGDIISRVSAKSSLYRMETLLTSTATATVAKQICLDDNEGGALPIQVAEK